MKKRRRITANLNEKIHLGHERDASDRIVVVDCEQEIITKSGLASTDQLECTQEVPPSPEQRKLFSSLQYNKNLLKYLNDDRQKHPSFCDLLIIVEGKEFSAHKVVVAVGSSYFHACLSKNPSTDVVTLDHVTHSVFQHLLEFLYTSEFFVYKNEIPLVLEAAKFLDIIDAVKLLNNEDVAPIQSEVVTETPIPAETLNDLTSKLSNSHQCTFCGRNFCYKKSLENHLAKAHRSFSLEKNHGLKMVETADFSTRRSTRNRKCPAKFDNSDNESGDVSDSNFDKVSSDKETSDKNEFDDSGSEYNVDEAQEEEMSGEDSETEEQSEKEHGAEESPEPVDSIGSIPEGLAPVMIQSSSKKLLQCPKCDKTFDRTGKYESHTRVHTGEKPFECDICHQHYSTKSNLTVHRKKHNSNTEFHKKEHKCPYCNKLHASKKTLAKHVKRFHPENIQEFLSIKKTKSEGWKCDICKKSFARRLHLEEHMILHSQDKPFKCTYCEEHFKSRFARLKHQEKFHLGPFPCDICGREFNDTGNLKRHIECTHGGKRKWTCFICGKSVRERTTLKEHLRIHSGEKPHLCSICGQSFRHGSSYRLHLRVHHDDKRYECEECGKTFIRHDHLTKHKKIHSGEKAHQCEECGKCFGRRDHLTVHYKSVHLGEKVWQKYKATFHQCEVCKKIFKGKSSLEMHFRTHSGEKPYKCQICNQSFRIKKTLTKHMVIHSDARPFNCQHCNATFKRKDKLKYHIDHVHGTKAAEETLTTTSEEKLVSLPVQYPSDEKVYETEAKQYIEQPKVYQTEAKTMLQNVSAEVCVPVTLVPVPMSEPQADLAQHTATLASQSHGILPPQTQQSDYQRATDLAFLEKYTLTPQPANIVHPVRPEQMLDPRDQSYLGTLLGLDTAPTVQNISNEHS
ncbi:zinc finger and BTB domain-containing protein 41 [Alligator sinensis]|uniref:Zinc finger and BTB domain-containing protein 41 n=1 Tax=Alligator sinensis TaxID=38654 RepID=A0A1U7SX26_ALLSI|nr:zinc finger and BTB domain-containing protein 41 [Alligator sinensis]XP_025050454.1 zinc finger and BTB domain-containing protein 41 [Alligator sinensis]XP_025050455.1 zinc finger and BTB domain-containing protein 41 [Alligator sinensis]XP_025050456.1 zinc finger and BTB domain-containing protein 41 [Alligator sinensis]XP_025050457.1 zinc finger and BTB domain-containing protein 41 [Alligator sinensis]XP_025050458.1 zinc finger and BTB domain-containing protein 41 [Alligator sinensis]XP_02